MTCYISEGQAFETVSATWAVTEDIPSQRLDDDYNRFSSDLERSLQSTENPQTGRKAVQQFTVDDSVDNRLTLYTVTVDDKIILRTESFDHFDVNGTGCRWLNDTVLLFNNIFQGSFLYNADTDNLVYFCYPFEETVPLTDGNDIDTDHLPTGVRTTGLLDVDIENTRCLYTVYEDIDSTGEWGRTIFYYNWASGEYFPIFDDPFQPPGTDVPVHLFVSTDFATEDSIFFSVNNQWNMNSQGEDVEDAYFHVDVPSRKITQIMTVWSDTVYGRTLGDYRIYYRTGLEAEDDPNQTQSHQCLLYNWRTGELDMQMDGHGMRVWNDHTLILATEEQTHIIDLESRTDYVLENSELGPLYPDMEFDYTGAAIRVIDPLSTVEDRLILPDVDAIVSVSIE